MILDVFLLRAIRVSIGWRVMNLERAEIMTPSTLLRQDHGLTFGA
jgi:hypothetical protein